MMKSTDVLRVESMPDSVTPSFAACNASCVIEQFSTVMLPDAMKNMHPFGGFQLFPCIQQFDINMFPMV